VKNLKTHEILTRSETNEWYTPPHIIELARTVMGDIDLDPASNHYTQTWIKAKHYYTKQEDGFNKPWFGRVWLNPPYGQKSKEKGILGASTWIKKALTEFDAGTIQACIFLVRGDSEGLKELRRRSVICLPKTRILFLNKEGTPGGRPVPGSEIHYLGPDRRRFAELFQDFGDCFVLF
jgi:hypothetical protein